MDTPIREIACKVLTNEGRAEISLASAEGLGAIQGINPEKHVFLIHMQRFLLIKRSHSLRTIYVPLKAFPSL